VGLVSKESRRREPRYDPDFVPLNKREISHKKDGVSNPAKRDLRQSSLRLGSGQVHRCCPAQRAGCPGPVK
jgi:hypothetical protein